MSVQALVKFDNPILKKVLKPVKNFEDVENIISNMFDTMYENDGIGLAADQIGIDLNIIIVDLSHIDSNFYPKAYINGKILEKTGNKIMEEGCLSLPKIRLEVNRAEKIYFYYEDKNGNPFKEDLNGLLSTVIQHEMDHVNGRLIIDYVSKIQRQQFLKTLQKLHE